MDGQNDFCEGGSLPIEGGQNDMMKIAQFIKNTGSDIKHIIATMDHHPLKHVGNANMWRYENGYKQLAPFSVVEKRKNNDHVTFVEKSSGLHVQCRLPSLVDGMMDWQPPRDVWGEETFKRPQTLWPVHCTAGTTGHALHPAVSDALCEWERYYDIDVDFIVKGDNPHIEEYSAVTWRKMDPVTGEIWVGDEAPPVDNSHYSPGKCQIRSPLLDKIFKYATGCDYYEWTEDTVSTDPPEMDVLLVTGLAENICVCETFRDIVGDIGHRNRDRMGKIIDTSDKKMPQMNFLDQINLARWKYYTANDMLPLAFQVVIVDDLTTGWVDPNIDRTPLQLVTSHITKFNNTFKWSANRAAAGVFLEPFVKMNAKYAMTAEVVKKYYTMFPIKHTDEYMNEMFIRIKSNGQKYNPISDVDAKAEYVGLEAYYKAVSNAPVAPEYADWGPVDALDRMYYNQYILQHRRGFMLQHYLLGGAPSVPPMTDMYTADYTRPYNGRGKYNFFGPNHIVVVVLKKDPSEEGIPNNEEFVVLVDRELADDDDNPFRFVCSSEPFYQVPSIVFKSQKFDDSKVTFIGGSYVPTPYPFKHAWCEATFFQSLDNTVFDEATDLSQWECASLRSALRLAELY